MRRIEALAAARAEAAADWVADAIDVPGVTVTRVPGGIVLAGAGLRIRMTRDARLRGIGLWAGAER